MRALYSGADPSSSLTAHYYLVRTMLLISNVIVLITATQLTPILQGTLHDDPGPRRALRGPPPS
jgi:hypothetical protein